VIVRKGELTVIGAITCQHAQSGESLNLKCVNHVSTVRIPAGGPG